MRILFISNSSSISGAPSALYNLVCELSGRHQVAVVLPDSCGPLYGALENLGVKCYCGISYGLTIWPRVVNPVKYLRKLFFLLSRLKKVRSYVGEVIDEFSPDIVHTNVGPLDLAYSHCRRRGIPHVWHLREFQNGMRFWPSRGMFVRKIHSAGNYNIAITRCVSEFWKLRTIDTVIYDGVDVSDVSFTKPAHCLSGFLFVGRIEKNKGLIELLEAYSMYRSEGGREKLIVVGRPSLLYGLRCRMFVMFRGLRKYVDFKGYRRDVPELMRKASALVVPSVTEGFGLASVEAMMHGCLVIGNDATGMKEQFDNGETFTCDRIGFRYRGVNELKDCLLDVSRDTSRFDDIRYRAFRTVTGLYDVRQKAGEIEDYYRKILEECI